MPAGDAGAAIPIRGINSDLPVRFAPNGGAVPGDRIVGILTPGEGITIYPIQSPALKEFEDAPERWLDLRWDVDERAPQRFPARIMLQSVNEPGIARAGRAGDRRARRQHRQHPHGRAQSPDFTAVTIDLEVYDLKHLNSIIAQLRAKEVVAKRRARERAERVANDAPHLRLGVNIDHVATIRNARGGRHPDPVRAAQIAIEAGADGITAHLREDRRHIRDDDIARLKAEIAKPLNFEMAATDEMVAIAVQDQAACRLPRAGAARGAHHRRRPRRRRPAQLARAGGRQARATPASACRCSSPPSRGRSRRRSRSARR